MQGLPHTIRKFYKLYKKFKIYGIFSETNGVREISYSGAGSSYFSINGQKYDNPKTGINIVVDGNETTKVVVK